MAHRSLTPDEVNRLAARHVDPAEWWDHICNHKDQAWAEARLPEQLAEADRVRSEAGDAYKPYAEILAEEVER
jgi:hypothetical protein